MPDREPSLARASNCIDDAMIAESIDGPSREELVRQARDELDAWLEAEGIDDAE